MDWINVKDKLPEKGQVQILVYCKEESYLKKGDDYEFLVLLDYTEDGKFVFYYNGYEYEDDYTSNVTHWMIPTKPQ